MLILLLSLLAAPALASEAVLAVLPFEAHTVREDLAPLGPGLADMLTTDLVASPELTVVERQRLDAVLSELALQQSAFVDPETASELGRGLGATAVVTGALTASGDTLRLDARVIDVDTATVVLSAEQQGSVDAFFDLERALALQVLDALEVEVPAAHRERLGEAWAGDGPLAWAARLATGNAVALDGTDPDGPLLEVRKKGLNIPGWIYVDGEPQGRPTRRDPVAVHLEPGRHEVAIGPSDDASVLTCWGVVEVPEDGARLVTKKFCDQLEEGTSAWGTALKGALVRAEHPEIEPRVSYDWDVDGRSVPFGGATVLNLAPGTHQIVITRNWTERGTRVDGLGNEHPTTERHEEILCHGTAVLEPGEERQITVSSAGCSGFDR